MASCGVVLVVALVLLVQQSVGDSNITTPFKYPLYKQCDAQWGKTPIGESTTQTICSVGCLMSSVSMALAGKNITVDGNPSNPGTLNKWLVSNGGYVNSDDLQETAVPAVNPQHVSYTGAYFNNTILSPTAIKRLLDSQTSIVIINVMKGEHFVLVTGYDDGDVNFYVNDPGFNNPSYSYEDIVGYRLFMMTTVN